MRKRPGNLGNWAFGDVTGDQVRQDKKLAKHLLAMSKINKKIAATEAKIAKLEAKQSGVVQKLAGWLSGWF